MHLHSSKSPPAPVWAGLAGGSPAHYVFSLLQLVGIISHSMKMSFSPAFPRAEIWFFGVGHLIVLTYVKIGLFRGVRGAQNNIV